MRKIAEAISLFVVVGLGSIAGHIIDDELNPPRADPFTGTQGYVMCLYLSDGDEGFCKMLCDRGHGHE